MKVKFILLILVQLFTDCVKSQTNCLIDYSNTSGPINENFQLGVFYVPKTSEAATEFSNCGIEFSVARTNIIETVLNSSSDLTGSLSLLNSVETQLQDLASRCEKLVFIFEKMPPWLSSSSDPSPAATPGWAVLHTKPPANWNTWQGVVDSITRKIVVDFGITNALFEVWNEPDLGSWSGTKSEYFRLFRTTFDGIKQVNPSLQVGGPTVNFWSNNLNWQAPYGYKSNVVADSSLIGELLDSSIIWNKIPDFISFHNFNINHQEYKNASEYLTQKFIQLGITPRPIYVTEWNAPSVIRDEPLSTSFMIKNQLEISKTNIAENCIAAWQDFSGSTDEFHNDYGLITYGGIHKPAYYSVQLSNLLKGELCPLSSSESMDGIASISSDTLRLLITNYVPPAFIEALNHTLFEGNFTINDLDQAGYIDIASNNLNPLDSIYKNLISIGNSSSLDQAINNSISVFTHFATIENQPREFVIQLAGNSGFGLAKMYLIDSTHNNNQFIYDSLRLAGFNQSSAISNILPQQELEAQTVEVINGSIELNLQANSVCLIEILLSQLNVSHNSLADFSFYPNPSSGIIHLEFAQEITENSRIMVYDNQGKKVYENQLVEQQNEFNFSLLEKGIYFISLNNSGEKLKMILN